MAIEKWHNICLDRRRSLNGVFSLLLVSLMILVAGLFGGAKAAYAGEFCSDYGGVIDGNVLGTAPVQITIDESCTFKNWPITNPLTTNINFQTNDPSIYLIIFDNVYYTGNMACANIPHKLWVVNSREDAFSVDCQNIIIPPETIDKQSPVSNIGIGEQFTYHLILPSMAYPVGSPSPNDIGNVLITDNLDATGAALTLVGTPTVTFVGSGQAVPHTFTQSTVKGGLLTFTLANNIVAGQQVAIDITVRVDNDPVLNVAGTQIVNTANWQFSRWIDLNGDGIETPDEFFNPLPGEAGIAAPITIGEPSLIVTKTSNQTALNIGVKAQYKVDVENVGGANAYDVTVTDLLPDVPSGPAGMCDTDPGASVTAEVFSADGLTSVSGPLALNTDFIVSYSGSPLCKFTLTTTSDKAVIGPSQRLVITYQSQLDSNTTADGVALTNVAGADLWYSAPTTSSTRRQYDPKITDGTPGIVDFQDSYTVTTALSGYYFEKTATNLVTGEYPAITANAGDTIQYKLRLFNVDQTIDNIQLTDVIDPARFDLSSFQMVDAGGGSYTFDSTTGQLLINGGAGSLDIAQGGELDIVFNVKLLSTLSNGDVANNQASISADQNTATTADDFHAVSDDPYINGIADPTVAGDEDPTPVTIQMPGPPSKQAGQSSATIGQTFTYTVKVPATPVNTPLYDVRILDDLSASSADLAFVSASVISGQGWALTNTGTATNVVLEDTSTGIDIPAGEQAVIAITVRLQNSATNQDGLNFTNSATYTYDRTNNLPSSMVSGGSGSSGSMSVVEPDLSIAKSVSFVSPASKLPTDPATVGDVLEYRVTLTNTGHSIAHDVSVTDTLPSSVSLVAGSATARIGSVAVAGFVATPALLGGGKVAWGALNGDESLDIPVGQALELTYQVSVDQATAASIVNSAIAEWSSLDGASAVERTGLGCPKITAPNDYCTGPATVTVSSSDNTSITKQAVNDSYAESPASTGDPVLRVGDTATYELTLNLQEYTTTGVVVKDVLPAGMAYDSLVSITPASGASSFTYSLNAQPSTGDTGTLTWDLGDVVNTPSNDGTPVDQLVIRYTARVVTDAAPVGINQVGTDSLTNQASLSYSGGDPATYPGRLTAADTIEVRQPIMSKITKVDTAGGRTGTGTSFDPYQVDIVNDTMNFVVSSCNSGLAPAYGVIIRDQLAAELDEGDLATNPPVVMVGSTTLAAGVDYTLTLPGRGGVMEVALQDSAPVNPTECVTVKYNIGFHNDIPPYSTWNNAATLAEYRSLPLSQSGRIYTPTDVAQVYMTNQLGIARLSKTLMSGTHATIGDQVVYQIRVPAVPVNANLDNVVISDTLPGVLEYVSATAVDGGGNAVTLTDNSVAPDQVSLGIAQIPAGEQVTITLTTRVLNNSAANAGVTFTNTASYTYTGLDPNADTSGTSGQVTLVEPRVAIAKTVTNLTTPGAAPVAGDTLRYSLTFTASGGATTDIYSDAFDLQVQDSLSLGLLYQPGTTTVNGTGNTISDPITNSGDGITTTQSLTWSLANGKADIDVAEGSAVTVSYEVKVLTGVQPGQDLSNSATVQWTGLNGASTYERTGTSSPPVNDYYAGPATVTVTSRLDTALQKSVINATTGQDPGVNATPGDTLRYTLVLTNNSIVPITDGVFTDALAAEFKPGTLRLVSYPGSADTSATNASGGANGTGVVTLRNLMLAAAGDPGGADKVTIEFTAQLANVLNNGTAVTNTGHLIATNLPSTPSNTTTTTITSAPHMHVEKVSQDLTNDPAILQPGDTLRYTITVKNDGDENATGVTLKDLVPTYTTYVANSTTLNGTAISDPTTGVSPLQNGMLINAPENPTAGAMRADSSGTTSNIATITFEVTVNAGVVGGTAISNQGFVDGKGAGTGKAFVETPSDDPSTPTPADPTVDVVGSAPLLDAQKTVALQVDNGSTGVIDPGDVLRYTIVITNQGTVDATGVNFVDGVPANTTYIANSVYLNGAPVGQPDGGVSPLISGIPVNSGNGAASGVISAGGVATVVFDVKVDAAATPGTLISNQGTVRSTQQADEPTDADGIDSNGDQPTVSVVGNVQQLSIIKEVYDVNGGVVLPGDQLEYAVTVRNIGTLPAKDVVIEDNLDVPVPNQLNYLAGSATLNGSSGGATFSDPTLTANYATSYGDLAPGQTAVLRFRASVDASQATGTTITNIGRVSWNANSQSDTASVSVVVGSPPTYTGSIGGTVWHDTNDNKSPDSNETLLKNWTAELYRNGALISTTQTDVDGKYSFVGLTPNDSTSAVYSVRFIAPGAGANTAEMGLANSPFDDQLQYINQIVVAGNAVLENLNLPVLPDGVVYDSVSRKPISGVRLQIVNPDTLQPLPTTCFDDAAQQGQVTSAAGYYRFDINFSNAACPTNGNYLIQVAAPSAAYQTGPSKLIPPLSDQNTNPFDVPGCLGSTNDAIPSTPDICEVVDRDTPPPTSVQPRTTGTSYYLHLHLNNVQIPGTSQLFNNHIAIDPNLDSAVAVRKIAGKVNVSRGDLVPYTITIKNAYLTALQNLTLVDTFPPGFKYVKHSARINGQPVDPVLTGGQLRWDNIDLGLNAETSVKLLFIPGAGVSEGKYVNRAHVADTFTNQPVSNTGSATVRVVPDPTLDCSDIFGKVFDDLNDNGYPDPGEPGIAGARVVSARGLVITTDKFGRFHLTCAAVPNELRGSNFILKLDDRSLPAGYRVTTENPRVLRLTRGKAEKFNFGASLFRVVRIDVADGVFEPGSTTIRPQWATRIPMLIAELRKAPSIVHVSYLADVEKESLVKRRVAAVKKVIAEQWEELDCCYKLTIETEIFWRRGAPPQRDRVLK